MQTFFIFSIILIILILYIGIYLGFFYNYSKKITKVDYKRFTKMNDNIYKNKNISNSEKILNFDKLYHKILKNVQYNGTFGEILKKNPIVIDNINNIWKLHKIRNKISHEFISFNNSELENYVLEYYKEVKKLLKKIK